MYQLTFWPQVRPTSETCIREEDSPTYRAEHGGPPTLTTWELLTLVTHAPLDRMQEMVGQLTSLNDLARADVSKLIELGFTRRQAVALQSAIELARRVNTASVERPTIRSKEDAAAIVAPMIANKDQEYLVVLLMDTRNRLMRPPLELYHGSLNSSIVRVGEVYRQAIKDAAAGIIVCHNHPSGDPSPSADDVALTRAIREAGSLLDITLLDHIVVSTQGCVSLRERGLM